MGHNKGLHSVSWILIIIGGLNWLLVGFGWNLVESIFGMYAKWIYILVGLSAIYEVVMHKSTCKLCEKMGGMPQQPTTGM